MPIPSGTTCALDKLYSKAAQLVARGPRLAREAILSGPERSFCVLDFLMERLTIFWQIKRSNVGLSQQCG